MLTLPGLAITLAALFCAAVSPGAATRDNGDYAIYAGNESRTFDAVLKEIEGADVVFVGENHDDKRAHELELAILQGMHRQNPALILSMEMFERDVQEVVDEYLLDYITETHLLLASRPWPNYKEDYRPLVEFCKAHQIPVVAANAPRRYVNIVTRKGAEALMALPSSARIYLAPLPYSLEIPPGYDKQLDEALGQHDENVQRKEGAGKEAAPPPAAMPAMPSVANMKQAQELWDATMADSLLRTLRAHRGRTVLQINGAMHSDSGYGIVARLRKAAPHLKVKIISIKPEADPSAPPTDRYAGVADYIILTRAPEEKPAEKP